MPGTVDDFIQRFNGPKTMDEQTATQYADRFASSHPQDAEFDNHAMAAGSTEYLGKLPDAQFQQAAHDAYANATPDQQQGIVGTLMSALQSRGINLGGLVGGNVNPSQVNPSQYAQIANWARQQHPDALKETVQSQPWFIKALGHPILMGALGMVAGHLAESRVQSAQPAQSSGGFLKSLF